MFSILTVNRIETGIMVPFCDYVKSKMFRDIHDIHNLSDIFITMYWYFYCQILEIVYPPCSLWHKQISALMIKEYTPREDYNI